MKATLIVAAILVIVGCYWQPSEPPILDIEYAGYFVATVRNDTTGAELVSFGYQQQAIDTAEAFAGQDVLAITASVAKGSFGEYVDLGTLTATLGGQSDMAPLGDPRADVSWRR